MVNIILLLQLISAVSSYCVTEPYKCGLAGSDISLYCESDTHVVTPYFIDPMGKIITSNSDRGFDLQETQGETTLTLHGAEVSDSGTYGCESGNCRGNITLVIYEHIEFPHRDVESFQLLRAATQGVITCTVSSDPTASTEWYFNNIRIFDNDDMYINGTNLVINNVREIHEGNYTCQAVFRKCSHIEKLQIGVTVNKEFLECFHCMNYMKGKQGQHPPDNCSTLASGDVVATVPCMSSCITIVAEGLEEHDLVSHLIRRDCGDSFNLSTIESHRTLTKGELEELKKGFSMTPIEIDSGRVRVCAENHCNNQNAAYRKLQTSAYNNKENHPVHSSTSQLKMLNFLHFIITITGSLACKLI